MAKKLTMTHFPDSKKLAKTLPKSRLLTESEWRGIGVQQSRGWQHYAIHRYVTVMSCRRSFLTTPRDLFLPAGSRTLLIFLFCFSGVVGSTPISLTYLLYLLTYISISLFMSSILSFLFPSQSRATHFAFPSTPGNRPTKWTRWSGIVASSPCWIRRSIRIDPKIKN